MALASPPPYLGVEMGVVALKYQEKGSSIEMGVYLLLNIYTVCPDGTLQKRRILTKMVLNDSFGLY